MIEINYPFSENNFPQVIVGGRDIDTLSAIDLSKGRIIEVLEIDDGLPHIGEDTLSNVFS